MAIAAVPPSISGTGGVVACALLDIRVRSPIKGDAEIIFFILKSSFKWNCNGHTQHLAAKAIVVIISCGGVP